MTDLTFDTTCSSQVIAGHCFDNGYGEKLPVFWKEYYAVYWYKNTCKDRCPEVILKIALNITQSVSLTHYKTTKS